METKSVESLDWAAKPNYFIAAWGLPIFALVLSAAIFEDLKGVIWPISLSWMGISCLINAVRCRRRHCFFTGPFFFILALASVLHGWQILSLGPYGWIWISGTLFIGGLGLTILPERIWGQYINSSF